MDVEKDKYKGSGSTWRVATLDGVPLLPVGKSAVDSLFCVLTKIRSRVQERKQLLTTINIFRVDPTSLLRALDAYTSQSYL